MIKRIILVLLVAILLFGIVDTAYAGGGKVSGGGTSTLTFRSVDDTVNTIVTEVGTSGNRTSVTLTV